MAEVLRVFDEPIRDDAGAYEARVVGRRGDDGRWEGWLEFLPLGRDGRAMVTAVESRQPERDHLAYWASGLTVVYAEGALARARSPIVVRTRVAEAPHSEAPASRIVRSVVRETSAVPTPIFDPFEVGARNLDILAKELRALGRGRLVQIIAAYHLNDENHDTSTMSDGQLVDLIVRRVESRLFQRRI